MTSKITQIGRYEVLEPLGEGAMGVVYLARDPLIGRMVALKTVLMPQQGGAEAAGLRTRVLREAKSAGILSHPGIVAVHDVIEIEDGTLSIAMEYVRGKDLQHLLKRPDPFSLEFTIEVVCQVASALEYAHSQGVVHLDVKPGNILVTDDGQIKLTDFGIAGLRREEQDQEEELLGTPSYLAPERLRRKRADHRSDIYSLGVVLYELITRHLPFEARDLDGLTHKILLDPPTPPETWAPGLHPEMRRILRRVLEKDPEARYQSAAEFASDLNDVEAARSGHRDTVPLGEMGSPDEVDEASSLNEETGPQMLLDSPTVPITAAEIEEALTAALSGMESAVPAVAARRATDSQSSAPATEPAPPAADSAPPKVSPPELSPAGAAPKFPFSVGKIAAMGALVVIVAGISGFLIKKSGIFDEVSIPGLNRSAQTSLAAPMAAPRHLALLREAEAFSRAGDSEGAALLLRRATRLAPDSKRVGLLFELAERQAAIDRVAFNEIEIQELLSEARGQLRRERYQAAGRAAAAALALDPTNEEAMRLSVQISNQTLGAVRAQVELDQRLEEEEDAESARRDALLLAASPAPEAAAEPVKIAEFGTLRVEFTSELPNGVLTIYAGENQIVREPFRFGERSGFLRRRKTGGSLSANKQVPTEQISFRVYVALPGEEARTQTVTADFRRGETRRLEINVAESGTLSAAFK